MESQVDKKAREVVLLVRRLASGSITNDQFENLMPKSEESALYIIYSYGIWLLCDDLVEHKLHNQWSLSQEEKDWVGHIIIFLRSGAPYLYPNLVGLFQVPLILLSLITFGWFGRLWLRYKWSGGDHSVRPTRRMRPTVTQGFRGHDVVRS
ncbi:MAG: hypothetical protein ABW076_11730 [Candidatus Thiodiazotropha sp.]